MTTTTPRAPLGPLPAPALGSLVEYSSLTASALASGSITAEASDDAPAPAPLLWEGVIGMEGTPTGDGRIIEPDALAWEIDEGEGVTLPIRLVVEDVGAHAGALNAGRILHVERRAGGEIWASGDFVGEHAEQAAAYVRDGVMTGVSMDLDSVAFEVRVAAEVIEEQREALEGLLDEEGDLEIPEPEVNEDGTVTVATIKPGDEMMVTTAARIRAVTLVSIPAFSQARISLVEDDAAASGASPAPEAPEAASLAAVPALPTAAPDTASLIAAAIPAEPPASWFSVPEADGPTPLVVTAEGQVYGHLATWDVCHIANPAGEGVCIQAPRSASGYAHFHTGSVLAADGTLIPTGRLTMSTGHAAPAASPAATAAHYDNTGYAAADVRAVDGVYGVWISGALRPGLSASRVRALRGSPLSGDWRRIGGNLELVGALAVNVPGFPIPRPAGLIASGELSALVASGLVPPDRVPRPGTPGALADDDLRYLRRLAQRERENEAHALLARKQAARAASNRLRVEALVASGFAGLPHRAGSLAPTIPDTADTPDTPDTKETR